MKYDAVGVARQDLIAGLDFLQEISRQSNFAWLSANLVDKNSGIPIFPVSTIRKAGRVRAAVIGLTDSSSPPPLSIKDRAVILPWQDVLPGIVAELDRDNDIIILLSNNSSKENILIAETVPGIHLIIQSGTNVNNQAPVHVNNTLICQTEKQGKHLGVLEINWQQSGVWGTDRLEKLLAEKRGEIDGINWRLIRLEKYKPTAELLSDSEYQALLRQKETAGERIHEMEAEIDLQKIKDDAPASYDNSFIAIDLDLPDDPEVLAVTEETKKLVNASGKAKATSKDAAGPSTIPAAPGNRTGKLAGWRACAECHAPQTDFWQQTGHAVAYMTLVDNKQEFNLDCLGCHVTYNSANGSNPDSGILSLPPELLQVGCEVCHGDGRQHLAAPASVTMKRKPDPATCLACHTPERDDDFNYDHDLRIIGCPKE